MVLINWERDLFGPWAGGDSLWEEGLVMGHSGVGWAVLGGTFHEGPSCWH